MTVAEPGEIAHGRDRFEIEGRHDGPAPGRIRDPDPFGDRPVQKVGDGSLLSRLIQLRADIDLGLEPREPPLSDSDSELLPLRVGTHSGRRRGGAALSPFPRHRSPLDTSGWTSPGDRRLPGI